MTVSDWLQICGGIFEAAGLGTVALGITETRRAFTNRPSLVARFRTATARVISRLLRRPQHIHVFDAAGSSESTGSLKLSVRLNFSGDLEERVAKLQDVAQRHEDAIGDVRHDLAGERQERIDADEAGLTELAQAREHLEKRISDGIASGLGIETAGVALFLVGVVLTTIGGVLS